jgi:hypothetical protein
MILDVDDLEKVLVPCPEWGGDVYVRVLTAQEREIYEVVIDARRELREAVETDEDGEPMPAAARLPAPDALPPSLRIPLVRMATCTAEGDALFAPGDEEWLAGKSQVVTTRIFEAAWKLNKMGRDDQEDLKKNSVVALNGALSTASPSTSA